MFVRVFKEPFRDETELSLHMLGDVRPRSGGEGSRIGTIMSDRVVYCPHPAEVTQTALRLCAGSLAGAGDLQLNLPPLMEMSVTPQSMRGQYLDLTGEHIRIVEETAPCGADGHLLLDGLESRILWEFAYDKQAALKKKVEEEARKKAEVEMLKTAVIGQLIPGKGIYGGVWKPKDRTGASLGKKFALLWDKHDLRDASGERVFTFRGTVATFAGQIDGLDIAYQNYNELSHENYDTLLYQALRDGSVIGKRFIPPLELVCGRNADGNEVFAENLYKNRDVGAFRENGGFITDARKEGIGKDRLDYPVWYWSGTLDQYSPRAWGAYFSDGRALKISDSRHRLSCRPVRVEALDI